MRDFFGEHARLCKRSRHHFHAHGLIMSPAATGPEVRSEAEGFHGKQGSCVFWLESFCFQCPVLFRPTKRDVIFNAEVPLRCHAVSQAGRSLNRKRIEYGTAS